MKNYGFLDKKGTFYLQNPDETSYLYFPLVGERGIKSSITPSLNGDIKIGQNQFILEPVSVENLHNNKSSRNFWCHVDKKGIWSATGASAKEQSNKFTEKKEETYLEAGVLWHKLTRKSSEYELQSEITSFVPVEKLNSPNVEIMQVTIKNTGLSATLISPTAAIPIYGRSADNIRDHRHVTSLLHRIKTTEYGVAVRPTLTFDERGHKKNNTSYFVSGVTDDGEKPAGFYPIVEKYIGEGGSFEWPEAIISNSPPINSGQSIEGYEAMGGIKFNDIVLSPQEEKSYIILIGMIDSNEESEAIITNVDNITKAFNSKKKINEKLESTVKYWEEKCNVSYQTSNSDFDNFMYWVSIQPSLRKLFGCSFLPHHDYGKGGRGWRDLWQDLLALIIMDPDTVKELLLNNFAGVRIDGTNATIIGESPGEFIADRNNITRVWMDHGVWPCITTKLYIDQTGDLLILLEENTYFKDQQVVRGSKVDKGFNNSENSLLLDASGNPYYGTVLEHLLLENLTAFYEVGENNHIRLRGADWNDALDMAKNRGESVAFTAAYAGNLEELADLISKLQENYKINSIEIAKEMEVLFTDEESLYNNVIKKNKLLYEYCYSCFSSISGKKAYIPCEKAIESLRNKAKWIKEHIRKTEWITDNDGSGWFNGYYDDESRKVEGIRDGNVRMMLTSQVFTIMSEVATKDQAKEIISSADKYLFDERVGGYRLNTDFNEVKMDLGRMFGFAYGHKENGAVFSHMSVMYANALYSKGFAKEGYKVIDAIYKQVANFEKSKIYPGIPEYFDSQGRGMYHYLTGSASWLFLTVITQIYGVRGKNGNLLLQPKLVKEQFDSNGKASISLSFDNKKFNVIYVNESHKDYGEYEIKNFYFNGMKQDINYKEAIIAQKEVKDLDKYKINEIVVVLGA